MRRSSSMTFQELPSCWRAQRFGRITVFARLDWTTELDGNSAITIVDGISALEPIEAGFSEDLVRAWYILTEQPVVTHLFAVPAKTTPASLIDMHELLNGAVATGNERRRDIRKALLADSSAEGDRLVDFFANLRYELDDTARLAAYSLIARGSGGTRFPLIREIPWWTVAAEGEEPATGRADRFPIDLTNEHATL